jgi:hypothetical protein
MQRAGVVGARVPSRQAETQLGALVTTTLAGFTDNVTAAHDACIGAIKTAVAGIDGQLKGRLCKPRRRHRARTRSVSCVRACMCDSGSSPCMRAWTRAAEFDEAAKVTIADVQRKMAQQIIAIEKRITDRFDKQFDVVNSRLSSNEVRSVCAVAWRGVASHCVAAMRRLNVATVVQADISLSKKHIQEVRQSVSQLTETVSGLSDEVRLPGAARLWCYVRVMSTARWCQMRRTVARLTKVEADISGMVMGIEAIKQEQAIMKQQLVRGLWVKTRLLPLCRHRPLLVFWCAVVRVAPGCERQGNQDAVQPRRQDGEAP